MDNKLDKFDILLSCIADYGNSTFQDEGIYYSYENYSLVISWKVGEDVNGSCWGDTVQHVKYNIPEPDFHILDNLLLAIEPELKLKTYKKIISKINFFETSHHEHYGNGVYFNNKSINKDDILNALREENIILCDKKAEELIQLFTNKFLQKTEFKF